MGHASFLIQLPGLNLLTDPVWSDRCSPVGIAGPRRFVPPPMGISELPPLDGVLLSHDHYDHLDDATVREIRARHGDGVTWFTSLGYGACPSHAAGRVGDATAPGRRRRLEGIAQATSRGANDRDGAVPPQPTSRQDDVRHGVGRRGVADSCVVSPPCRSYSYDASSFLP
ncbi:MAG: MBL fold metallo-hydrolase [Gemmatimonadota bacterium]